jgi:hypothetical protein
VCIDAHAAESELLRCGCSYVTLDTTEPPTRVMRFLKTYVLAGLQGVIDSDRIQRSTRTAKL